MRGFAVTPLRAKGNGIQDPAPETKQSSAHRLRVEPAMTSRDGGQLFAARVTAAGKP